jgi:hypothetical protein
MQFLPKEVKDNDAKDDFLFVKNFAKIGSAISDCSFDLKKLFDQWLFSAEWVLDEKMYNQEREKYGHYKLKILELVKEIEKIRKQRKKVPYKKLVKIDRVRRLVVMWNRT